MSSELRHVRPHYPTTGFRLLAQFCLFAFFAAVVAAPQIESLKEDGTSALVRQGVYLFLLFLAFISVRPWANLQNLWSVAMPVVIALALGAVSITWSVVPGTGIRRLFLTALVAWTLATLVRELGYDRSIAILRAVLSILLIVNFVAVAFFPALGIHQLNDNVESLLVGDWRGVMAHKNFAGAATAVTILVFLFDAARINMILRVGVILAALFFLYYTQSKTSVAMLVSSAFIGYLFGRTSFSGRLVIIPMLAIAAVLGMIYFNIYRYMLVQAVNDPTTFTGRILIWRALMSYAGDNIWFGTGYGSFWNVGAEAPIYRYATGWVSTIASGHNGYLDLACTMGLPLAAAVVFLLIVWPFGRILVSSRTVGGRGALLLSLLIFCAGHNMTESTIFDRDTILNAILLLTIQLIWTLTDTPRTSAPAKPATFRPKVTPRVGLQPPRRRRSSDYS